MGFTYTYKIPQNRPSACACDCVKVVTESTPSRATLRPTRSGRRLAAFIVVAAYLARYIKACLQSILQEFTFIHCRSASICALYFQFSTNKCTRFLTCHYRLRNRPRAMIAAIIHKIGRDGQRRSRRRGRRCNQLCTDFKVQ